MLSKTDKIKKLCDELGVVKISHRRWISEETIISDLKQLKKRIIGDKKCTVKN